MIATRARSNALKFTREGTVRVVVERDAERLRIEVRDTGVGIPPECQARIFDVFERVEPAEGPRPGGVGLGLYIVKSLVHLLKGTIEVTSDRGAGSCFTIRLPLRLDHDAAQRREVAAEGRRALPLSRVSTLRRARRRGRARLVSRPAPAPRAGTVSRFGR